MIRFLLIANVIAYFLMQTAQPDVLRTFALWPLGSGLFLPWQLLTYAFLHGGVAHLAFNMYGLWMFGTELERVWGPRRLAVFYAASVLAAAVAQLLVTGWLGSRAPTVGASGGLFGLMLGFAYLFPQRRIMLLIPPIPLPAPWFVALYGALELTLGISGSATGIAHFAHLGGLVGGWLVLRYWSGKIPFGTRR